MLGRDADLHNRAWTWVTARRGTPVRGRWGARGRRCRTREQADGINGRIPILDPRDVGVVTDSFLHNDGGAGYRGWGKGGSKPKDRRLLVRPSPPGPRGPPPCTNQIRGNPCRSASRSIPLRFRGGNIRKNRRRGRRIEGTSGRVSGPRGHRQDLPDRETRRAMDRPVARGGALQRRWAIPHSARSRLSYRRDRQTGRSAKRALPATRHGTRRARHLFPRGVTW